MKNRALQTIEFLKNAPERTLSSYRLDELLHTGHASRAIDEAQKLGYEFERGWTKIGGKHYKTYTLLENAKLLSERKPVQYEFSGNMALPILG